MVTVEILNNKYEIINDWEDLTLEQYIEVQQCVDKAPKKLKNLLELIFTGQNEEVKKVELSDREKLKTFPKFYGDMIVLCSNIPKNVINQVFYESREQIFMNYLFNFAFGALFYAQGVDEITTESFEFEGDTYWLPKAKKIMGVDRPMGWISTVQFTEAADLDVVMREFDKGDYHKLANIVAILCLKEGEEYDEDVMLERAEKFKKLTMDIVWDVFFYLDKLISTFGKTMLTSSLDRVKRSMQQQLKPAE